MNNALYFLVPWESSVIMPLALLLTAMIYARGCMITPLPVWRKCSFALGLLGFYIVSFTQYDYYAEHEFMMHRIQHNVLHHLSPFLIALSRPGIILAAGTPERVKRYWRTLVSGEPLAGLIDFMNRPCIVALLFCSLIYFWLIPSVHFFGMLDARLYKLMNWGMAINGLMFWSLALNNFCLRPGRLSPASRIAMMLAIIPPQIVAGMVIFSVPHEIYPLYSLCGRAFDGISALDDQRIGGLILWIPAAMMSVFGMLLVIRLEWLRPHRAVTDTAAV